MKVNYTVVKDILQRNILLYSGNIEVRKALEESLQQMDQTFLAENLPGQLPKESEEREQHRIAYNRLSKALWIKFLVPTSRFRKLSTNELERMYKVIREDKSLDDAYAYAISARSPL
ncbi:hypothetical protein [Paenibacillus cremeus]|uniref:Uncharacterized protein n=1 Tax=Paenibacillus cremeus TaxID=2163881 RepID=A0A559K5A9_9BACL|nr:hypothetical protein [Paenibacillus cremeus]TVY07325.1 hypothetical protein FPZ49_24590 [Paenibacillus cremeus]